MKRKFFHPEPSERELSGPHYWRSLDELSATPGFKAQLAREFPEGSSTMEGVDRRQFTKIMAASFALGGLGIAGCRRPEQYVLPWGKSVEGVIQGLPLYFATAMPLRKSAIPLLAETHQGRPTKLEGNPTYAPHGGASTLLAQASVLDLYDPDRATKHRIKGSDATSAQVTGLLAGLGKTYAAAGGEGLAFLAEESSSPTRARLLGTLRQKFPRAIWAEFEPVQDEPPVTPARAAFGRDVKPIYRFARAKRIVSIDADFFHAESGSLYYAREFAKGRRVTKTDDPMNRLYVVESGLSLTGSMADHRLRLASSHMAAFAAALAGKVMGASPLDALAQGLDFKDQDKWLTACADDLSRNRGECLVVAGAHQSAAVHAIVYALNSFLGNVGTTVDFVETGSSGSSNLAGLATAIRAGSVRTLIILGGNPAYNAPADLAWASLQKSVPEVIRLGGQVDETSVLAGTHIAATHYLESWGDARTVDGTIVPVQPMILPLFNGLTEIEVLAHLLGEAETDPYSQVYATVTALAGDANPEKFFRQFLHDGLIAGSAYPKISAAFNLAEVGALFNGTPKFTALSKGNLEVRFISDCKMDDGRFANNGWLQECPDPITKISWDNAIQISPVLARELGVYPAGALVQVARVEEADLDAAGKEMAHVGEVSIGGRSIRGPLHIQPGLSNYTIILPLGYGRTVSGHVGQSVGFSAYALRTSEAPHFAVGATLTLTGERFLLANTQAHWSMEGRDIVREVNYEKVDGSAGLSYQESPGYVKEVGMESETPSTVGAVGEAMTPAERATQIPRGNSLYSTPKFDGLHQWGMSIDLNTCIGCNTCVVACQAENNIPIVGKDQALRGREMHWIRLDRYYSDGRAEGAAFGGPGNHELPEDPQISLQPVACQHCELAPCEMVCPVNATVHDEEGLNVMAYNRCIGTRYCANNCPYKVRRFNFFDFNERQLDSLYLGPLGPHGMPELVQMVKNPEVSVRMRGVMEKCTYCVQRIQNAKIEHTVKATQAGNPGDVIVPDGTIRTACQQACPVEAIVFGNILDDQSAVSQAKRRSQDYQLLGYLNTRPRTTYLGKLRNPNSNMPDYATLPRSRQEHDRKSHPAGQEENEKSHSAALTAVKRRGGPS